MATPILEKISKDLAYKLQDPATAGTANGVRLSADERLGYILRGYRRLLRIVTMLYPSLIQKLFQSYYTTTTGSSNVDGQITNLDFSEVFNIYCKLPDDEDYAKAIYISPDLYLDVKSGQNKFYNPDLDRQQYYWTLRENDIYLLPAVELAYEVSYRTDIASLVEAGGYGGSVDLDIPTEHLDLLISIACSEAYMDIGEPNMVQLYKADLTEQLSLLNGLTQKKELKDETA